MKFKETGFEYGLETNVICCDWVLNAKRINNEGGETLQRVSGPCNYIGNGEMLIKIMIYLLAGTAAYGLHWRGTHGGAGALLSLLSVCFVYPEEWSAGVLPGAYVRGHITICRDECDWLPASWASQWYIG